MLAKRMIKAEHLNYLASFGVNKSQRTPQKIIQELSLQIMSTFREILS